MTARSATDRRAASRRAASSRRSQSVPSPARRRRLSAVLGTALFALFVVLVVWPYFHEAVKEITLPLRHEDIIRQQASEKGLDPALIAAVIYSESRFRDNRTSPAGAEGLMQITPNTARDIARKSGGVAFRIQDLGTPQVNISYGAYYLRYLLDRYGGNETLAVAAYNGGEGNVDHWIDAARRRGQALTIDAIPFGETRAYVRKVERAKHDYRDRYASELGL
jgi:soluble lytic murein transglycosylase